MKVDSGSNFNQPKEHAPSEVGQGALLRWFDQLNTADRGGRAALRRSRSITEVMMVPAFHRLHHALGSGERTSLRRLAVIAGVLAHVTEHVEVRLAELMAGAGADAPARVHGLRFRRLLKVEDPEQLLTALIRVVRLIGNKVDVNDLANIIRFWGDRVKQELALAYYSKAPTES